MKCTKCSAHNNSYGVNCTPGFGPTNPIYMFVGEMYGKTEIEENKPFVGSAGKILMRALKSINIDRDSVFITNACRCYIEGNKTPNKSILDACFIHLNREVKKTNPKLIISLGISAFISLTNYNKDDFKIFRGRLIYSNKIKSNIYVLFHPASLLYNNSKEAVFFEEFLKIPSMLNAEPFETKHYNYTLVDTVKKFDKHIDIVDKELGIDIETTGLNPYNPEEQIRTIQIGTKDNIYVITPNVFNERVEALRLLLNNNYIIGQDYSFDAKWLYVKLGVPIKKWYHDTCLAEFILTGMKNNDLDFTTGKYNPEYYGYWKGIPAGGSHLLQNMQELYQYGADDVGTMFSIKKKQEKALFKNGQDWLFKNITMPCNKLLTQMSLRGVKVDLDTLWKTDKKYERKAEKALMRAQVLPGIKECELHFKKKFNPQSSIMIKWLLLDYYKLPVLKKTKKDNPSVSQKEMETYAKKYKNKYCQIMEKYRSIQTIRKNFLSGTVPKLVDGVAHTNYSLHATETSRPNSKDPNLLNIPREKDIKRCYVARDGCSFVCGDEAQLEVRVTAEVYKEPRLIEICNDLTKDIHSSITAKAFGKSYDEVYNGYKSGDTEMIELRVKGKSVQFGVIYQQQAVGLAYMLGTSEEEAQQFIDDYYSRFTDLRDNIEKLKQNVIKDGHLYNLFGVKRTWKYHTAEDKASLREAVNFLVQSLAWNLIQLAMIEIDKRLEELEAELVMQVYDSIIVECPDEEIGEVVLIMKDVMENINKSYDGINEVLLSTDIEVGKNLADLEKV